MGVVFCSYPSLEGGGPSSDQDQKWCLFKWYWHNFFSFSQYVQKDCRKNEKGTKDPNGIDTLLKMLLFVLIWPFQTSPFEVCPLFFLRGGERKIIYLHHLPSVKVMSFWHFSRRMWLSLYVLHCVTSHCFLHCCNIILTLFFVLFFCICVIIWFFFIAAEWFLLLTFTWQLLLDNKKRFSEACRVLSSLRLCGWRQKRGAEQSTGCAQKLQAPLCVVANSEDWKSSIMRYGTEEYISAHFSPFFRWLRSHRSHFQAFCLNGSDQNAIPIDFQKSLCDFKEEPPQWQKYRSETVCASNS